MTRTDTERLEWLARSISGRELRRIIGTLSYTGDVSEIRAAIDAAMNAETP